MFEKSLFVFSLCGIAYEILFTFKKLRQFTRQRKLQRQTINIGSQTIISAVISKTQINSDFFQNTGQNTVDIYPEIIFFFNL
ncbi:hypothetical protein D1AOALGA4SA_4288 [Olavius algarvensis Delta 1 endosymbiont]|nr:hypothetical protein D1AOALGA4SA_4288 [Olavius algarvensis Delta 1 endosymbiont]